MQIMSYHVQGELAVLLTTGITDWDTSSDYQTNCVRDQVFRSRGEAVALET